MKITTVLFDLDGTLLPMDQQVFVRDYFGRIARCFFEGAVFEFCSYMAPLFLL